MRPLKTRFKFMAGFPLITLIGSCALSPAGQAPDRRSVEEPDVRLAQKEEVCDEKVSAQIRVDQGHPWRPPFGVDRVGAPPVVHVVLSSAQAPRREYYVVAYRHGEELERLSLNLVQNQGGLPSHESENDASPFFAHTPLTSIPEAIGLYAQCPPTAQVEVLTRVTIDWPEIEADAVARPDLRINPVDLGTILVPHDWLLLAGGQTAVIEAAAISRSRNLPNARLQAWFEGGKAVESALPLAVNQRAAKELELPLTFAGDSTILHVSLTDGDRELWKKEIRTVIVAQPPSWPVFGAVETRLRYDAPISVNNPETGAAPPTIDYDTAWNPKLHDVVVFLPNGSRFVFWRGSSYAPFWAGRYNTGFSYQWAETIPPPGFVDAVEPLQDKELRYGRVRIIESTPSRVHVRWTYQSVDFTYKSVGDEATEDFYFYPDGFGTRVVTLATTDLDDYVFSEFIILAPQRAFPLDILPNPTVDMLFLDGEKQRITFPLPAGSYGGLTLRLPGEQNHEMELHPVERLLSKDLAYQKRPGEEITPADIASINQWLGKITHPRQTSIMYRVSDHKDDEASPIYFSPHDADSTIVFLPFYDQGQLVTPGYWGNHWPLGRGALTGGAIDDRIYVSPSHFALMDLSEPEPLSTSQFQMLDTFGRSREMTIGRWVWLIARTDAPDEALLEWAHSFSNPPSLEVTGARMDFPSYSPERRTLRLIAESYSIEIKLKPMKHTVNPVFELDQAPKELAGVTIDGKVLPRDAYAWDGATLWVKANIGAGGAKIRLRFQ